jgi:hypothetical protein
MITRPGDRSYLTRQRSLDHAVNPAQQGRTTPMTICFSFAQDHLVSPRYQTLALKEFAFAEPYDKGDDQSDGAVWQAGLEGLEPQLSPSMSKRGVLFLVSSFWGVPPKYELGPDASSFQSYEGLLNGQRYTITFGRRIDYTSKDAATMASQFLPMQVLRRKEFTAVKRNIGVKAISAPQSQGGRGGGSSWIIYDNVTVVPKPISTGSSSQSSPGQSSRGTSLHPSQLPVNLNSSGGAIQSSGGRDVSQVVIIYE